MNAMLLCVMLGGSLGASHEVLGEGVVSEPSDVLVFTRTMGFRHGSIERGVEVLGEMAQKHDRWRMVATEDPEVFTVAGLEPMEVVVFLNTTMDVLDESQQAALQGWIEGGGGWVGIHAAADTEYGWPFYGTMLGGAWFASHPHIQPATIVIEDLTHPSTKHLAVSDAVNAGDSLTSDPPVTWTRTDEWYNYRQSPRGKVHVIASLSEDSYTGGSMQDDHPIVWTTLPGKGAAFYTGLGHTNESWDEPAFIEHIAGAIDWAADDGWVSTTSLSSGTDWSQYDRWIDAEAIQSQGSVLQASPGTGVLVNGVDGHAGELVTARQFGDCDIHMEFMVPEGSNSGVYVQGRYEVQILDSFGIEEPGSGDCGGIYQRWDESRSPKGWSGHPPSVNASTAPGTWQTFDIRFTAPRFGKDGNKTTNARFDRVVHNGQLVHEDVELTGPTRGGWVGEVPQGPIRFQGDHGPVALRNIRIRSR